MILIHEMRNSIWSAFESTYHAHRKAILIHLWVKAKSIFLLTENMIRISFWSSSKKVEEPVRSRRVWLRYIKNSSKWIKLIIRWPQKWIKEIWLLPRNGSNDFLMTWTVRPKCSKSFRIAHTTNPQFFQSGSKYRTVKIFLGSEKMAEIMNLPRWLATE